MQPFAFDMVGGEEREQDRSTRRPGAEGLRLCFFTYGEPREPSNSRQQSSLDRNRFPAIQLLPVWEIA